MKIYLNKEKTLRLTTDSMDAWIDEKRDVKDPKANDSRGYNWVNVTGYYVDLRALLKGFMRRKINMIDADTLEELNTEIRRIEAKIDEAIPILQKTFSDRRRKEFKSNGL